MSTVGNLLAFSPELWLLLGAIVIFAAAVAAVNARTTTVIALTALVLAFAALATQFKQTITILDGAFVLDGFAIVMDVVILVATALAVLATRADVLPGDVDHPAAPGFYLLATLGAMLAVSSAEIISLFVSLELLAINLYLLASLARRGPGSSGVTIGFTVVGGVASALFLYGLALLFGLTGQTQLHAAGTALSDAKPGSAVALVLLSLLIAGLSVRMGLLPMRWWTRGFEVGVALRAVLLIQSVGAITAFAVFGRVLATTFAPTAIAYAPVLAGTAAVIMTGGTLLSITQTGLRRMIAYGSIAQGGLALATFTNLKGVGIAALLVFLVALAATTIGAFAAVIAYSRLVHSDSIRDLAGIAAAAPGVALALSLSLLSLAGIPPLAGFLGKLLILQATVSGGYAWLAVIGAVNIIIAGLGYVRVIKTAFIDEPVYEVVSVRLDNGIRVAVTGACLVIVFMGLLLAPLYSAATYAASALLH